MNGNSIIAKKNDLVSQAAYRMDHYEHLIFLSALSQIDSREQIDDQTVYTIDVKMLAKTANIGATDYYSKIKKSAQKLFRREISIPLPSEKVLVTRFLQAYEYHDGEALLSIQFSNRILPYISFIKDSFVSYKFKQVAQFKSSYSVRLYELLIQRIDLSNTRTIELDQLRTLLKLGKSYQAYSNIKLKVITPAIKDINTYSDINVTYSEVRIGRKVTALEFHIEALEPRPKTKKQLAQVALPGETYGEVKERLKKEKEPKKPPFWEKILKKRI